MYDPEKYRDAWKWLIGGLLMVIAGPLLAYCDWGDWIAASGWITSFVIGVGVCVVAVNVMRWHHTTQELIEIVGGTLVTLLGFAIGLWLDHPACALFIVGGMISLSDGLGLARARQQETPVA